MPDKRPMRKLIGLAAVLLSGCYTVVFAPAVTTTGSNDPVAVEPAADAQSTRWENDYFRYPGTPSHSYSAQVYPPHPNPYASQYGNYGYGYPYYDYQSGYGYGYDPYYSVPSSYIPPGYRLIDANQLQRMEETIRELSVPSPATSKPGDTASLHQEQEETAWDLLEEPRVRSAPTATRRAVIPTTSPSTDRSAVSHPPPSSSSTTKPSSGTAAKKSSSRPKKRSR